jgi:uncharacterized repeat protein (TIGR04138 family)
MTLLPFPAFSLNYPGEQAHETGANGAHRHFGIVDRGVVCQVLPHGAPVTGVSEAAPNMQEINFDEAIEHILVKDQRYTREAYLFVREALDFTQKLIVKDNKGQVRHVSGQELLDGIRQYALIQFGPMSATVLEEWGVKNCSDFGEVVFNMVEASLLAKTENDTRSDFHNGYDFTDAFRKPFLPESKLKPEAKQVS